jgi:hypothetical protein
MNKRLKPGSVLRGRRSPSRRPSLGATIGGYLILLFLIVLCGGFGGSMIAQGTIIFITCQPVDDALLSCSAQTRILGIFPIRQQIASKVNKVDATAERIERTRYNRRGFEHHDLLLLYGADGTSTKIWLGDGWKIGTSAADIKREINALLTSSGYSTARTLWHGRLHGLVAFLFGLPFFAVALLLLGRTLYELLALQWLHLKPGNNVIAQDGSS